MLIRTCVSLIFRFLWLSFQLKGGNWFLSLSVSVTGTYTLLVPMCLARLFTFSLADTIFSWLFFVTSSASISFNEHASSSSSLKELSLYYSSNLVADRVTIKLIWMPVAVVISTCKAFWLLLLLLFRMSSVTLPSWKSRQGRCDSLPSSGFPVGVLKPWSSVSSSRGCRHLLCLWLPPFHRNLRRR